MAYDPGALSESLASAVGDDPVLIAELRRAFLDSVGAHLRALILANDEAAWQSESARLAGLAASFGARDLQRLAHRAMDRPLGDRVVLQALAEEEARLGG